MRIITHYFDWNGEVTFRTLLQLMEHSFKKRGVPLEPIQMPTPKKRKRTQIMANHEKLKEWEKVVRTAEEPIILLDTDMYCLNDFREVVDLVKHVGVTYRPNNQWPPVNGGFVVVQPTEEARQFMAEWVRVDKMMFDNPKLHAPWRDKWAGMNQSSYGYLIDQLGYGKYVSKLPCDPYNCVEPWHYWRTSKLVHVKGDLRKALFGKQQSRKSDDFVSVLGMLRLELAGMLEDETGEERHWICKNLRRLQQDPTWGFFSPQWTEIGEWGTGPQVFGICKSRINQSMMKQLISVDEICPEDYEKYMRRVEKTALTSDQTQ